MKILSGKCLPKGGRVGERRGRENERGERETREGGGMKRGRERGGREGQRNHKRPRTTVVEARGWGTLWGP